MVSQASLPSEGRLFLFGVPHAEIRGQVLAIAHRKPLALLAYLAVTRRVQSREVLAAMLWPEYETSRAYAYLRNTLWQLGQMALGDWIIVEQAAISLDGDVRVDACAMDRHLNAVRTHSHPPEALCADCVAHLTDAVALYQGDFMAGFGLPDSPDFEEWQYFQTEHFRQEAAGALERLTRYHAAHGDIELALASARRWSALDPLDEPAQRALMTLYARAGQRAAAVHQYETLLRNLKSSRLEPAPETVAVYKEIRAGEIKDATLPVTSDILLATPSQRPRHNLPAQTTTFIGRNDELAELYELLTLPECRLVTLTGPGGIGKTRLAIQAAHEQARAFPDGVVFVPLADASDQNTLVSTIAEALGTSLYPQHNVSPREQLLITIEQRKMLLVLDNIEHLLEYTDLLTDILSRAPDIKLLTTSRERLNLRGEWVMDLRGLACVAANHGTPGTSDAVALFMETAQRITAGFSPNEPERAAIARICDLVEGMPLGIELAAAWTKMLSCAEIADEIEMSLDFLSLTLRDLPERHQSLRAVFARSWGLLPEESRRHFRSLAVFCGGFTREAARAVVGAELPELLSLADKSLLYHRAGGSPSFERSGGRRYEILEVLRQYAEEQLQAIPGEHEAIRDRHALYYLELVQRTEGMLKGTHHGPNRVEQHVALDALQNDMCNVRRAWSWAAGRGMFREIGQAALGLGLFCEMRSRFREGETLFGQAAEALQAHTGDTSPALLGLLRGIQGEFMSRLGHAAEGCAVMEQARVRLAPTAETSWLALIDVVSSYIGAGLSTETRRQRIEESLHLYSSLDDGWGVALVQEVLGEFLVSTGDVEAAEEVLIESLAYRRGAGDDWGVALALHTLATVSMRQEQDGEVVGRLRESVVLRERIGDTHGIAIAQVALAQWMAYRGNLPAAQELYTQSLRGFQEIGDLNSVANVLSAIGKLHRALGDLPSAHRDLLSALEQRRLLGQDRECAQVLWQLGQVATDEGALPQARDYLSESLAILSRLGDESEATAVRSELNRVHDLGSDA